MARGRKRKDGARFPGGKLRQLFDRGNERVAKRAKRFIDYQNGKAEQQVFDPIGRAWAVGLLENPHVDPAALRDAGRNYAARYWGYYPSVAGVSNYERDTRDTGWGDGPDPRGKKFEQLDKLLAGATRAAYSAAQSLCIDLYWFPDDDPLWLARLIDDKVRHAKPADERATGEDKSRLKLALDGLLAMTAGTSQRIAA